jgi:UDP-N-acetyl-D-glucosamine dehydrogenase
MELLAERGAVLSYHDPFVPALPELALRSTEIETVTASDAVVLVTAHPGVDHALLVESSELFIDLRGTTRHMGLKPVVRL